MLRAVVVVILVLIPVICRHEANSEVIHIGISTPVSTRLKISEDIPEDKLMDWRFLKEALGRK